MDTILIIIVLIFAALVLLLLEILTPAFGVLAGMAIAALVAAIVLSFTLSPTLGVIMIIVSAVGVPVYLVYLVKLLPNTPLGRKLFLRKAAKGTGEGTPKAEELKALIGKTGTVETPLRPAGAVRIEDRRVSAIAESEMIEKDAVVKVIRSHGTEVVVRRQQPEH
ncbi:MAG: NfeD family protein [Phycisphaerae bacterium]|nr:NfeD family protein [Phycisphaerae bacterium]